MICHWSDNTKRNRKLNGDNGILQFPKQLKVNEPKTSLLHVLQEAAYLIQYTNTGDTFTCPVAWKTTDCTHVRNPNLQAES